jgi:rubrerythrin
LLLAIFRGYVILECGQNNPVGTKRKHYWRIDVCMDKVSGILKFAARMENDARDFYNYYGDKVKSQELREIFSRMASIEELHHEYLTKRYEGLMEKEPPKELSWNIASDLALKDPHILADTSNILGEKENGISDLMVIRMAYLIEKEFEEFYKNAVKAVDDEVAKKILTELSVWEGQHKDYFEKQYEQLLSKNWEDAASILFAK